MGACRVATEHLGPTTIENWRTLPEKRSEPYPTKLESRNRHAWLLLTIFPLHILRSSTSVTEVPEKPIQNFSQIIYHSD